jgi:uncharacterized protein YjbI with pentapeptide repeats
MRTQATVITEVSLNDSYQMIKDEQLSFVVVAQQILAGSKILLSNYQQVVFSDCTFYACEFQGVTFENCVFENCSFEFSHIRNCFFKNCNFTNCNWKATSTLRTTYQECDLDPGLSQMTEINHNELKIAC